MKNNYQLKPLNNQEIYLICMDFNGILDYIDDIEKEYIIESNEGKLIIDQLLITGNGKNRFISCEFSYGKINLGTAKNIQGKFEYRSKTSQILIQYYSELKYSILSEHQLQMLLEGQAI